MIKIKRALLSVSNKEGIVAFASCLRDLGVEIISTGGTAALLRKHAISVIEISEFTGCEEMLDGRVKTLHPKVHAGLLALRADASHMQALSAHGMDPIDLVAVNLYPFEKVSRRGDAAFDEVIENIDIGGPAMIRSAAKNHRSVAVVTDPSQYGRVAEALTRHHGALTADILRDLAGEAFRRTAAYDAQIGSYLDCSRPGAPSGTLAPALTLSYRKIRDLRYGENPHQKAALYAETGAVAGMPFIEQIQGKELSYNNILDTQAACDIVAEFRGPAAVIVKHNNPCGAAQGATVREAFLRALACDSLSAFGGIVAVNRTVDARTAAAIAQSGFLECVAAPGFAKGALKPFEAKKNLRILVTQTVSRSRDAGCVLDFKKITGGLLVQEKDAHLLAGGLKVVTSKRPTRSELRSLAFAWAVAKHVKSNAIVIARGTATVGIGAGQMSRVDSVIAALRKAGKRSARACLASDAFFPKPDSIEEAARAGVSAIIQPGGSIADDEIILACNRRKIAMVFTGIRHFKH
jgi:phosphoribosylaminoimidazolecarboxamide formyltransferase/IMP cyclohydrolase